MVPLRTRGAIVFLCFAVAGCAEQGKISSREQTETASTAMSLQQAINSGERLNLEETSEVINVEPHVTRDEAGNFLIADARESQVRVYDPQGKLLRYFGRRGGGPDEFNRTKSALITSSGDIVVIDATGKVAVFPPQSDKATRTFRLPVTYVWTADLINDDELLVAGRRPGADSLLLHRVDLRSASILNSFFPIPATRIAGQFIENNVGSAAARAYGDTITAVYSVSDTVYVFDKHGAVLSRVPLGSNTFRSVAAAPPSPPGGSKLKDLLKWVSTFSLMIDVVRAPDGGFLVQYLDRDGEDLKWSLARITQRGDLRFDLKNMPQLLAASRDGSQLWFVSPTSETPNEWVNVSLPR